MAKISREKMRAKMRRIRSFKVKKSKTVKSRSAVRKPMARRRKSRRSSVRRGASSLGKARGKFGNFLRAGIIGDTGSALGAGLIVSAVTNRVMPSITPYASLGAGYLAGGLKGAAIAELIKPMLGMPSVLSSITGGLGGLFGNGQNSNTLVESL